MTRRLWFGSVFAGLRKRKPQEPSAEDDMELAEVIYTFMQNPPRWPENEIIGHIAALIRYRDFDEAGEPVFLHAAAAWRPAVSRQNGEA